jgi:hypothetical protein
MSTFLAMALTGGIGYLIFVKSWWVGITEKRVIFMRLSVLGRPDPSMCFMIPLADVKLTNKGLSVITPKPNLPQNFRFHFGAKRVTGLDLVAFKAALNSGGAGG